MKIQALASIIKETRKSEQRSIARFDPVEEVSVSCVFSRKDRRLRVSTPDDLCLWTLSCDGYRTTIVDSASCQKRERAPTRGP